MAEIVLHPLVDCDREAALLYFQRESEEVAREFDAELERAWVRIVRNPQAWGGVEFGLRRYVLDQFPYAVIYRPTPSSIYVVAIIHLRRKPSYWHDRLRDLPDSP